MSSSIENRSNEPVDLIDTHVVVWATLTSYLRGGRVMARSRQEGGVAIADTTFRELAFLAVKRRISISTPLDVYLDFVCPIFHVLPIDSRSLTGRCVLRALISKIPPIRSSGHAIVHGLPLVTKDVGIRRSGEVNCIW